MVEPHTGATPEPPYVAVIFTFQLSERGRDEYEGRLSVLGARAQSLPGFLGEDALRLEDGRGLSVSYWTDMEAVRAWRSDPSHREAIERGRAEFYDRYTLRVATVERVSAFTR